MPGHDVMADRIVMKTRKETGVERGPRSPEKDAPSEVALGVCAPPAAGGRRKSGTNSSSRSSSSI